jgi:hypothetical protein
MRSTVLVIALICVAATASFAAEPPCPGHEIPYEFVLERPAPYLDPEDQDAVVIRNEKQWCEFWGWDKPCDTAGIDFSNEVALAVYLPQVPACDTRDLTEVCGAGGRHLRVVVDVVVNRPCLVPAFIPSHWYVVTVDKPVASACTEYIWTFNVQGEPPYTQSYGCE